MKTIFAILVTIALAGCSSISKVVPSFWDDNQSSRIIDVRFNIERLDCHSAVITQQVSQLRDNLLWFELYSESKGVRQQDVIRVVHPIRETVEDMYRRYQKNEASTTYCEIKVRILKSQSQRAAEAVLGRF